jgi:hypothetical protein
MAALHASAGNFVSGTARLLHSGPGSLLALSLSHGELSAQVVSLHDGLNAVAPLLLRLHLPAGSVPVQLVFSGERRLVFQQGLYVDPGGCDLHLVTVGD